MTSLLWVGDLKRSDEVLVSRLEKEGYEVVAANTMKKVRQALKKEPIEAVLVSARARIGRDAELAVRAGRKRWVPLIAVAEEPTTSSKLKTLGEIIILHEMTLRTIVDHISLAIGICRIRHQHKTLP